MSIGTKKRIKSFSKKPQNEKKLKKSVDKDAFLW